MVILKGIVSSSEYGDWDLLEPIVGSGLLGICSQAEKLNQAAPKSKYIKAEKVGGRIIFCGFGYLKRALGRGCLSLLCGYCV